MKENQAYRKTMHSLKNFALRMPNNIPKGDRILGWGLACNGVNQGDDVHVALYDPMAKEAYVFPLVHQGKFFSDEYLATIIELLTDVPIHGHGLETFHHVLTLLDPSFQITIGMDTEVFASLCQSKDNELVSFHSKTVSQDSFDDDAPRFSKTSELMQTACLQDPDYIQELSRHAMASLNIRDSFTPGGFFGKEVFNRIHFETKFQQLVFNARPLTVDARVYPTLKDKVNKRLENYDKTVLSFFEDTNAPASIPSSLGRDKEVKTFLQDIGVSEKVSLSADFLQAHSFKYPFLSTIVNYRALKNGFRLFTNQVLEISSPVRLKAQLVGSNGDSRIYYTYPTLNRYPIDVFEVFTPSKSDNVYITVWYFDNLLAAFSKRHGLPRVKYLPEDTKVKARRKTLALLFNDDPRVSLIQASSSYEAKEQYEDQFIDLNHEFMEYIVKNDEYYFTDDIYRILKGLLLRIEGAKADIDLGYVLSTPEFAIYEVPKSQITRAEKFFRGLFGTNVEIRSTSNLAGAVRPEIK